MEDDAKTLNTMEDDDRDRKLSMLEMDMALNQVANENHISTTRNETRNKKLQRKLKGSVRARSNSPVYLEDPRYAQASPQQKQKMKYLELKRKTQKEHYAKTVKQLDKLMNQLTKKGVKVPQPAPALWTVEKETDYSAISKEKTDNRQAEGDEDDTRLNLSTDGPHTDRSDTARSEKSMKSILHRSTSDEDAWKQARHARYVRPNAPRNIETVLSNKEIFSLHHDEDEEEEEDGWWKSYCHTPSSFMIKPELKHKGKKHTHRRTSFELPTQYTETIIDKGDLTRDKISASLNSSRRSSFESEHSQDTSRKTSMDSSRRNSLVSSRKTSMDHSRKNSTEISARASSANCSRKSSYDTVGYDTVVDSSLAKKDINEDYTTKHRRQHSVDFDSISK